MFHLNDQLLGAGDFLRPPGLLRGVNPTKLIAPTSAIVVF
jgi:hypothetical protein